MEGARVWKGNGKYIGVDWRIDMTKKGPIDGKLMYVSKSGPSTLDQRIEMTDEEWKERLIYFWEGKWYLQDNIPLEPIIDDLLGTFGILLW